jgi:citrate synthase
MTLWVSFSRPEPLHELCQGGPGCTSEHGQADLQAHRESNDPRCNGLLRPARKRVRGSTDRDALHGVVCTLSPRYVYKLTVVDLVIRFLFQLEHLSHSDAFPTSTSGGVPYKPHPVLVRALDVLFILHADHEMNASSTTVLQTGSSLPDPYSAIAAGCASL